MTNIMISIKDEIAKDARAKLKGQVSSICERALALRLYSRDKSDAPDECIKLECCECHNLVDKGFLCETRNKFICTNCHVSFSCKGYISMDKLQEHVHLALPGVGDVNMDAAVRLSEKMKNGN